MKLFSKIIISFTVEIATLYTGFTNISFGGETNVNGEYDSSFYNTKAEKQSVLYRFLHERLFMETFSDLMLGYDLCDYCQLQKEYSFKFSEGLPDFLNELDIIEELYNNAVISSGSSSPNFLEQLEDLNIELAEQDELKIKEAFSSATGKRSGQTCNLCELLVRIPFELRNELLNKLSELSKEEYFLLREQDREVAEEISQLLDRFSFESLEELEELNAKYEKLYNKIGKMGNFPNLSDNILLLKNVTYDVLVCIQKVETREDESGIILMLTFANGLAMHKKFLVDNSDILLHIETIAKRRFQIGDEGRKIKDLSEIMPEVERMQAGQPSSNESAADQNQKLNEESAKKDLL